LIINSHISRFDKKLFRRCNGKNTLLTNMLKLIVYSLALLQRPIDMERMKKAHEELKRKSAIKAEERREKKPMPLSFQWWKQKLVA